MIHTYRVSIASEVTWDLGNRKWEEELHFTVFKYLNFKHVLVSLIRVYTESIYKQVT